MELRDLQTFVMVVERGGFGKAAEALCVTQPAVTRQIKSLEQEIGTLLLERMGRRVSLTAAGTALFAYATRLQVVMDEAKAVMADLKEGVTGRLRVGASSTAATYILPGVLSQYKARYPKMELRVQTGVSARIVERVLKNEVDVGVVMDFEGHSQLVERIWREYSMRLLVYPNHPVVERAIEGEIPVSALEGQSLIVMEPGTNLRGIVDRFLQETGIGVEISLEMDNVEAIKKMVESRLGIALLPEVAVLEEVKAGRLVELGLVGTPEIMRSVSVIYRKDKYLSGALLLFMEMVVGSN